MSNGTKVVCPGCWGDLKDCVRCRNARVVLWDELTPRELDIVNNYLADVLLCKTCGQLFMCRCPIPKDV